MQAPLAIGGAIHLLGADRCFVRLEECAYDSEALLQSLLAEYPDLLVGEQIDSSNPRRWLLVGRELAIPAAAGGEGRWPVDHLFLDQDAIPTIVEVKRSMNTRTRRELVGQMLDYAASAVTYWQVETLRAHFAESCATAGRDPSAAVRALIGDAGSPKEFWARVKANLQAVRLRLIFVADVIPSDLLRVVDFLNEQMSSVEVLAVEVKQYLGQGHTALIPCVVSRGSSIATTQVMPLPPKASALTATSTQWNEGSSSLPLLSGAGRRRRLSPAISSPGLLTVA